MKYTALPTNSWADLSVDFKSGFSATNRGSVHVRKVTSLPAACTKRMPLIGMANMMAYSTQCTSLALAICQAAPMFAGAV